MLEEAQYAQEHPVEHARHLGRGHSLVVHHERPVDAALRVRYSLANLNKQLQQCLASEKDVLDGYSTCPHQSRIYSLILRHLRVVWAEWQTSRLEPGTWTTAKHENEKEALREGAALRLMKMMIKFDVMDENKSQRISLEQHTKEKLTNLVS